MALVVRFVDAVPVAGGGAPTTLLDLNTGSLRVGGPEQGLDLSPAPKRRVVASSMLADGDLISASAWSNRTLKIPVQLLASSVDVAGDQLTLLAKELAKERNVLQVSLGTDAVYFKTYAAPDYAFNMRKLFAELGRVVLEIPADPFGVGPKEVLGPITVNNDPAAGSNGMFFDVSNVKGDVETPLVIRVTLGSAPWNGSLLVSAVAVRRRGTVANTPAFLQAEAMTQGTDTTTQANDAAFSGASNNWSRTTFATQAAMETRLSTARFPSSSSVDARGEYIPWVRCRRSTAGDTINVRLGYGYSDGTGNNVFLDKVPAGSAGSTDLQWVRLGGPIPIPAFWDPVYDGYGGPLAARGISMVLQAERLAGSGNLDWDCLALMPADDQSCIIDWPITTGPDFVIADGVNRLIWMQEGTSPAEVSTGSGTHAIVDGEYPHITPGVTNRIFWMANAGDNAPDVVTHTSVLNLSYWPLYTWVVP